MYRERIRESYGRLSKSQKRVADYLMTSQREVAFMTASRLAAILDVDVATVTRFAQRLKYSGYPDLLDDVRSTVQAEMNEGFRPIDGMSEAGRAFVRALNAERENLERTLSHISIEAVEKAVAALLEARHIYVLGASFGLLLAQALALRLELVGLDATPVSSDGCWRALDLRNLGAADAVLGFGFSGYAADVAAALRYAKDRGATTIGVSGSDVSPVARAADIVLICSATSALHIPSEVGGSAVIEGLWEALAVGRMDAFNKNVRASSDAYLGIAKVHSHSAASVEESIMKLY